MRRLGRLAVLVLARACRGFHEGPPRRIEALGFLPWSNAVHYNEEPGRREAFREAVADGMPAGYGAGDAAALHFVGTELERVVSSRPRGAGVLRIGRREAGRARARAAGALPWVAWPSPDAHSQLESTESPGPDPRHGRRRVHDGRALSPRSTRFVLELTGKPVPKLCFLPTASGDPRDQVTRFHERFGDWPCEPSDPVAVPPRARPHRPGRAPARAGRDLRRRRLDAQHARGLARARRRRGDAAGVASPGVVLAGLSAGAMCWFEGGISMSGGAPAAVARARAARRAACRCTSTASPSGCRCYRAAIAAGELPAATRPTTARRCCSRAPSLRSAWRRARGRGSLRVQPDGRGGVVETALAVRLLAGRGRPRCPSCSTRSASASSCAAPPR